MKKNDFHISEQAIQDLNDIWAYSLHKWSQKQADRYYNLIIEEIKFIADNFMTEKSIDSIRKHYRMTKVKSHLIFYKITTNDNVEIVRILHQRMEINKQLK